MQLLCPCRNTEHALLSIFNQVMQLSRRRPLPGTGCRKSRRFPESQQRETQQPERVSGPCPRMHMFRCTCFCLDSNYARGVPNTYIHIPTTYLPTYLPAPLPTSPPTKECTYAHTYMPTYGNMHTYVQPIAIHAHTWSGVLHSRAPPLVWSGGGPRGRGGGRGPCT